MGFRYLSLFFFVLMVALMPVWPWSRGWAPAPAVFCGFVGVLTLLVSFFAKRGSSLWKHKGQG